MVKTLKFILYIILLAFSFALGVRFSNYFDSKFLKGQTNGLTKHEKEIEETFKNLESPKYNEEENSSLTDEGRPDVVSIEEVDLIQTPASNVEDVDNVNKDTENKIDDIPVNNEQVVQETTKNIEEVTQVNPNGTEVVSTTTEVVTETTVSPVVDSDKTTTNTVVEQK